MSINEHTGDEMKTGHASDLYRKGWDAIFNKPTPQNEEQHAENSDNTGHTDKTGSTS